MTFDICSPTLYKFDLETAVSELLDDKFTMRDEINYSFRDDSKAKPLPAAPTPPRVVAHKPDEPEQPPPRGLTTEDIESFKALGTEVCLDTPHMGEIWLVPEYTSQDRRELTPEHAATLYQVLAVFPGAEVVSFEKSPTTNEEDPS